MGPSGNYPLQIEIERCILFLVWCKGIAHMSQNLCRSVGQCLKLLLHFMNKIQWVCEDFLPNESHMIATPGNTIDACLR